MLFCDWLLPCNITPESVVPWGPACVVAAGTRALLGSTPPYAYTQRFHLRRDVRTTPSFGLLTALTFFTPSDSTWVLGVRKWMLSTMTQITTTMVTSTMPKSRNLWGTFSLEPPGRGRGAAGRCGAGAGRGMA